MRSRTFIVFSAYIWTKTLLGLTFHPFMSVRSIVRRPILTPVIFSPVIGLVVLFLLGRIGALLINVSGLKREFIAFMLSSALLSILMWQVLLFYLLGSFLIALRKK